MTGSQPHGPHRLGTGGHIDRGRHLTLAFDGRELAAHPGDTLASALLANGIRTVSASTYLRRPRGIHGIDTAEACGYVQVESGSGEPMVPATMVEVYQGLRARSLAGRGELRSAPDTARYDKTWAHCDVLVVGGGPAGTAAARAAVQAGARVILADDRPALGGKLRHTRGCREGVPGPEWAERTAEELRAYSDVRILNRTTVTGHYTGGALTALQRRTDHLADPPPHMARHRLWHIRAAEVVLATGTIERPIAFAGNDRPGVMLAGAAVGYAWGYGVLPGRRAVVFGAHDGALAAALDLADAGAGLAAVLDTRPDPGERLAAELRARGVHVLAGHGVTATRADADGHLAAAVVAPVDAAGRALGEGRAVPCDLLAVSGGADPDLPLLTQRGGTLRWSDRRAAWLPGAVPSGVSCAGSAAGEPADAGEGAAPMAVWSVTAPDTDPAEVFVDLQRDATLADMREAAAAGMTHIEHLKRHTTIGTGPDQGRTSGPLAAGLLSQLLDRPIAEVGGTRRRPPVVPVPFAAVAGRDRGDFLDPVRRTPMHDWHVAAGAVFEDVGQWKRPRYYPRAGGDADAAEDMAAAVRRECRAARSGVAVIDASTLGKILIEGSGAPEFLDRIYANTFSSLPEGRCRYGVMCGADGMVLDDGVSVRLAADRYLMTTTSGNSDRVLAWLEDWLQTEWPQLCVHCTPVTDHWAAISVVGPRSREVVGRLAPGLDLSAEGFEFMGMREADVAGVPARVLRVSFSGELTYEIYVPSWYGLAVWEAVMAAGRPYGITPYGTEAMHVLRAEKGFIVVGHETDGTTTPVDAGLGWAVSTRKDFVGKRSLARADTDRSDRQRLVGLLPRDQRTAIAEGAQLIAEPGTAPPVPMLGHVTSSYPSSTAGPPFALALVAGGERRHGETLYAYHLGDTVPVTVTDPIFYDREGARRDG